MLIRFAVFIILFTAVEPLTAAYWIHPNGTALWTQCKNDSDPSGNYCSMATANSKAVSGDIVFLKGGTYNSQINPQNSGADSNNMLTYKGAPGEEPIIDVGSGIFLDNKQYIKVEGITVSPQNGRTGNIRNNSSHIEISHCRFIGGTAMKFWGQCFGGSPYNCSVSHIWLHDNIFIGTGSVGSDCQDNGGNVYLGSIGEGDESSHFTFENNTLYWGGHHLMETFMKRSVVRNNVFHNEGWMSPPDGVSCRYGPSVRNGLYGNRCLQIYDGHNRGDQYNLLEGNRSGHAAFASDGGMEGTYTLTAPGNIVRYNVGFHSETAGIYFKVGGDSYSRNNRVYNNTVFNSGQESMLYPDEWTGFGDHDIRDGIRFYSSETRGNVVKNNLVYNSYQSDIRCDSACLADNAVTHNWVTSDGDPLFINTDVSDAMASATLPDLRLSKESPVINHGTNLTEAIGAGNDSTTLVVQDACYFQDGTIGSSLSDIQADWISIGTVSNGVQTLSIDYSADTITLTVPRSWRSGDKVWLYKKSDGARVLYGTATDYGAHEYEESSEMAAPKNLRVGINF